MAKTLQHAIMSALSDGPLAVSELYEQLKRDGHKESAMKSGLKRLVTEGSLVRSTLGFKGKDTLVSVGPLVPGPKLVGQLVEKEFYGRRLLMNLFRCLRTELPAVTRADVAKIAALDIGKGDQPDWEATDRVIAGLVEVGLLREGNGEYWVANKEVLGAAKLGFSSESVQPTQVLLRERYRQIFAQALLEWLRTNSFVSWGGNQVCDAENPTVNAFGLAFDFLGFDFSGVRDREKFAPQPVVGDVLRVSCNAAYARSFVERVGRVEGRAGRPRAFIYAASFSPDALSHLKENGVYPWTHNQLLGETTAKAFQKAIALVESLVQQQQLDPTLFMEVFNGLENFRSVFGNMKGHLFELIMGYVFQRRGYTTRLAWPIDDNGKDLDVDVRGYLNTTAIIVECKGLREDQFVSTADVKKHFTQRTQIAHKMLRKSDSEKITRVHGIIVTTASFDPESVAALETGVFGKQEDLELSLWDRERLITELKTDGHKELIQIIQQFYSAPPGIKQDEASEAQVASHVALPITDA